MTCGSRGVLFFAVLNVLILLFIFRDSINAKIKKILLVSTIGTTLFVFSIALAISVDSVRFLMSDYFRSRHADNSLKAIANTDSVLALDLPKAIVPTRLISMMGAVCRSHTLNFNEVMSLPQVENGIATDMAPGHYH